MADARMASGRDIGELAWLLGISYEAYEDLERFDEEVVDSISLGQIVQLAGALQLDTRSLFDAEQIEHVEFSELAGRLQRQRSEGERALFNLEEEVGWELGRHLDEPDTFGELPALALADIGGRVGLDWRSFLPPSAQSESR